MAFWQNRINPLKRDKPAPHVARMGAWAIGRDGVTAITGDGIVHQLPDVAAFAAWAVSMDAPYTWYTHGRARESLDRIFDDHDATAALVESGHIIHLFQSQGRCAALEVFTPEQERSTKRDKPHWSFRDLGVMLPGQSVPRDARDAAAQTLRRVHVLAATVHERFGTHLEMTATRTGYMGWRRTIANHHWRQPAAARREIRQAYKGGYTRAFTSEPHYGGTWHQYDIRSAYPAAMREGVPVGQPVAVDADHDRDNPDAVGFYEVEAILPPRGMPVLLAWSPDGDTPIDAGAPTRLWVSSQELWLARDLGVVARVLHGWVYPDGLGQPFDAFVDTCEAWRDESTGSNNALVKLIQNTLYGKFGTKPEQREVIVSPEMPEGPEWMPYYGHAAPTDTAWYRMVDTDNRAGHMIHWAAWITASVRCKIIRTIAAIGPEHVLYVDTDCIITSAEIDTGTRYGDWVLQRVYREFTAYGGKRYHGRTVDGAEILKHAGISADEDDILQLLMRDHERARDGPSTIPAGD